MNRNCKLSLFLVLATALTGNAVVWAGQAQASTLSTTGDASPTSNLGCAVRLMVFAAKSKDILTQTTDATEQAQVRNNFNLANRGFAFFVARLDPEMFDPNFRPRAERVFEALRGLSGDVMVEQAVDCVKIWQKSENVLVKTFQKKP
jgi:hypothetical protein